MKLNINDEVTLSLTESGVAQLLKHLEFAWPDEGPRLLAATTMWPEWRSGRVKMPLWSMAQIFGPQMGMGSPLMFETTIEVKSE